MRPTLVSDAAGVVACGSVGARALAANSNCRLGAFLAEIGARAILVVVRF